MLDSSFKNVIKNFVKSFNFSYELGYNALTIILGIFPFAYFGYMYLMANDQNLSFKSFMMKDSYSAVMMIIAIVDILWGYMLWIKKNKILKNRKSYLLIMWTLLIQQILLGNLASAIVSLICLFYSKKILFTEDRLDYGISAFVICTSILFIFCVSIILRIIWLK